MLICVVIHDLHFGHWVMVVSASFLYFKGTVFPFLNTKCLVGRYFETVYISTG